MNYKELIKRAKQGGNLFDLIDKHQDQHNPHKGLRDTETYKRHEAAILKNLCYQLLNELSNEQTTPTN